MSEEFNNNQTTPEAPAPEAAPVPEAAPAPQYQDAPQSPQYAQQPATKAPTNAIVSLVLGIISVVLAWPTIGIVGIVCGIIAILLAKKANKEIHTGVGTAGFVLGIIGLALGAIALIVVMAGVALFAAAI